MKFDVNSRNNRNFKSALVCFLACVCTAIGPEALVAQEWVAFAGGGFAGKRIPFTDERLVVIDGEVSDEFVDIEKNQNVEWRPTVTGGVEVRWHKGGDRGNAYFGVAGFAAVLSDGEDPQVFAPGAAVTGGKGPLGFILGFVFSPTDEIKFPNDDKTFRARIGAVPNFKSLATSNTPRLFFGFRGVALNFGSGDNTGDGENN